MLNIHIKTIPHKDQQYETIGDWRWDPIHNRLNIHVSDLNDTYKEYLVAIHELIECYLCFIRGISQQSVDEFDKQYEKMRSPDDTTSEPGDDIRAPYRKEHFFATNIERMICHEMGIDWNDYEKTIYSL